MPEAKKATLTTIGRLDAALGKRPDLQVVTVADGARDNWRFLDALAPEATAVVDFFHATEQLKSALDACYGENDPKGRAQFEKLRHVLRDDPSGVEKVIRALSYQRDIRSESASAKCFDTSGTTVSMRYAQAKARHLPMIGRGRGGLQKLSRSV